MDTLLDVINLLILIPNHKLEKFEDAAQYEENRWNVILKAMKILHPMKGKDIGQYCIEEDFIPELTVPDTKFTTSSRQVINIRKKTSPEEHHIISLSFSAKSHHAVAALYMYNVKRKTIYLSVEFTEKNIRKYMLVL